MSVVFDTNVLIYASDHRDEEKRIRATTLLAQERDAILLWQVACEFIGTSRKLGGQGFTPDTAWRLLDKYRKVYQLFIPTASALDVARELHVVQQVSLWDALLLAACREAGVTRLYSEDLPGRIRPAEIEVVNSFA